MFKKLYTNKHMLMRKFSREKQCFKHQPYRLKKKSFLSIFFRRHILMKDIGAPSDRFPYQLGNL